MNYKPLLILCFLFSLLQLSAQEGDHDWENPEVFAINREKARATFWPYDNAQDAAEGVKEKSPYFMSLSGTWKFHWVSKPADRPLDFYKESYDVSRWDDFTVPGNWELHGYGTPIYVSGGFGFPARPPYIPNDDNPVGSYRRTFELPENWDGRRVYLHFESGVAAMYVWVNGEKVGYSQVTKSPCEFDITAYVRKGTNTIALEVYRWSDGSYLEDQDFWRLSGFDRNIFLYSTAQTRIADFFALPDLDKNYKNGIFSLDVNVRNYTKATQNRKIEIAVTGNQNGKKVLSSVKSLQIPADAGGNLRFEDKISSPKKWSAETPNLYTLVITMKDENGNTVESTSCRIGFRKVEIKDGVLMVNGKRIFVRGTNIHEHDPVNGHVIDRDLIIKDIQLMKQFNLNAIRTSHYPQPTMFYELCDEYGMYVVDEANSESHGMGYGKNNPAFHKEWLEAHLDRAYSLVERDKNHTSVIVWSLGNEASNGDAYHATYRWIKDRDVSRPVQYEQAGEGENTDIVCPMYPSMDRMKRYASEHRARPYIMCEYSHAMGNSNGNFMDYFEIIRTSKNMQGGFIWDWADQGILTKDEQGRSYYAYGGDLGGYTRWHSENFCANGLVSADRIPHPGLYEVKKGYQPVQFEAVDLSKGIIKVINEYNFTNLNTLAFSWQILENGEIKEKGTFDVNIPGDSQKEIRLGYAPVSFEQGKEYHLQVFASLKADQPLLKAGHEIAREEFEIVGGSYFARAATASGSLNVSQQGTEEQSKGDLFVPYDGQAEQQNRINIETGDIKIVISKNSGKIESYSYKGKALLRNVPQINFWRAPNDNDFGWNMQKICNVWREAGQNVQVKNIDVQETPNGIVVNTLLDLVDIGGEYKLIYTVTADGAVKVQGSFEKPREGMPEFPRFGMIFPLSGEFEQFSWYGRGPWENYSDRNKSSFIGVYESTVTEQYVPYIRPQENGNKTDVRWLTLANDKGEGIRIEGLQPLSVSALHYRIEDMDPGMTKKQQHTSDLVSRHEVLLNVDYVQSGVGGDNSWGAKAHEKYRLLENKYEYGFVIRPLEGK